MGGHSTESGNGGNVNIRAGTGMGGQKGKIELVDASGESRVAVEDTGEVALSSSSSNDLKLKAGRNLEMEMTGNANDEIKIKLSSNLGTSDDAFTTTQSLGSAGSTGEQPSVQGV